ncbi:uncharacterized protein LOC26526790 [Drosophila erecta]|uniref:Uncharacterized protein n=1 Tax=Drosophila erecta TaxID=7220 RepID=A0A0Q5T3M5_DROER|nr:uncharacterized protein LOC26526790 [Drosophila erecta]KQS29901.1 uncharacterized protein Dere_GG26966 [Drosophila erecta]
MNMAQRQDSNHRRSLNLLDKTLPISVATAPQLRSRRQFSFNGLQYEMNGLLPLPPPPPAPQVQLSRLRAGGGGGGGSQEKKPGGHSSHSLNAKSIVESAGGDGGTSRPNRSGVLPKHVSLGDRALLMNGGVRMPRRSEVDFPQTKAAAKRSSSQFSIQVEGHDKKVERKDATGLVQDREALRWEKKHRRRQHSMELSERTSSPDQCDLTSQQSWMLAQTLLKAYGSGLAQTSTRDGASSKMDYITLTGLVLGCVASQALFFLCWYFSWLKNQAIGLRKRFLGNANLWEFFDLEDTTRYSVQTKLILAPLILICSLLYCVVNLLHLVVQVVRSDVPRTVVVFVQRVANSGLLGTITMGLAGAGGGGSAAKRGRHNQALR